jgi:hypothetical protein
MRKLQAHLGTATRAGDRAPGALRAGDGGFGAPGPPVSLQPTAEMRRRALEVRSARADEVDSARQRARPRRVRVVPLIGIQAHWSTPVDSARQAVFSVLDASEAPKHCQSVRNDRSTLHSCFPGALLCTTYPPRSRCGRLGLVVSPPGIVSGRSTVVRCSSMSSFKSRVMTFPLVDRAPPVYCWRKLAQSQTLQRIMELLSC